MSEEEAPKKRRPIEIFAEAEPIKLGSMLLTLVEPHRGHEVAYNRWYERDHFYSGCMVGPYNFAGRRFVATADLKALRDPDPSAITGEPARGSYVSVYWVLDGYFDMWNRWALRQVNALHAAGRMFEERDHVHTLLYHYQWEHRREPDGVPVELALDHPYRGFVTVFIDRDDVGVQRGVLVVAAHRAPARADAGQRCRPGGRLHADRARGGRTRRRAPREGPRQPHRAAVVPQHAARGGLGAGHRRAPAPARGGGQGHGRWPRSRSSRPSWARTPTPTSSGPTDSRTGTAPDRRRQPRARISTWVTTKTASSDSAQRRNASAMRSSSAVSLSPYSTACSAKRE